MNCLRVACELLVNCLRFDYDLLMDALGSPYDLLMDAVCFTGDTDTAVGSPNSADLQFFPQIRDCADVQPGDPCSAANLSSLLEHLPSLETTLYSHGASACESQS